MKVPIPRLSRPDLSTCWDCLGITFAFSLIALWILAPAGRLIYAGLIMLTIHAFVSIEIIRKRQARRVAEAEKIVKLYRNPVVKLQPYPSGLESLLNGHRSVSSKTSDLPTQLGDQHSVPL